MTAATMHEISMIEMAAALVIDAHLGSAARIGEIVRLLVSAPAGIVNRPLAPPWIQLSLDSTLRETSEWWLEVRCGCGKSSFQPCRMLRSGSRRLRALGTCSCGCIAAVAEP